MRAAAARADRWHQVREAGRGWRRAGAIDESTLAAIESAYPDDRVRLGLVFRILVCGFSIVIVNALFGLFALALPGGGDQAARVLLMVFGIALVVATEIQIGPLRRAQGGSEAATALLGVCYLLGGLLWQIADGAELRGEAWINLALVLVVTLLGAAAYRWGYALFAAVAAGAMFLLLARGPFGRPLWILLSLVLVPFFLRAGDSARLAPAHRDCCRAVALVALLFLYLALHLGSWDSGLVEDPRADSHGRWRGQGAALRPLFAWTTALLPAAILAWGIGTRSRLLINAALAGVLASVVTLRFYVHLAPLWVALLAGGGIAIGLALLLRRYLDSGRGQERYGVTAEPLFADPERRGALEVAASMASLSPAARPIERPGFEGGGGRFGGGGASGTF